METENKILESISFGQVDKMKEGETINLGDGYELYHYIGDCYEDEDGEEIETEGVIVLIADDQEKYCILLDYQNRALIFEEL